MKLSSLALDTDAQEQGVIFHWKGLRLRIARTNNPAYQDAIEAAVEPLRARLKEGQELSDDELRPIVDRMLATHILLGIEGAEGDDGKPLQYTPEYGFSLLNNPAWDHLRRFVQQCASQEENFLIRSTARDSGNSSTSSAGSSITARTKSGSKPSPRKSRSRSTTTDRG